MVLYVMRKDYVERFITSLMDTSVTEVLVTHTHTHTHIQSIIEPCPAELEKQGQDSKNETHIYKIEFFTLTKPVLSIWSEKDELTIFCCSSNAGKFLRKITTDSK